VLGFSNFLNYRFEFEKKLKTFLELNANIKSLELFHSFKESISELRPLYLLKLICQKKKNPFGVFAIKNANKSEEKLLQYVDTLCSFVAG